MGVFDAGERGDCHLFTGDACWLFIALFYGSFRDILLADELCVHEWGVWIYVEYETKKVVCEDILLIVNQCFMSNMQTLSLHQKTKKNFKNERVMAITEENIRGKIGNSIFYRVGSVTRVRSAASKYTDANTSKQRESRSRLRVAIRFYRRLAGTELREAWYLAAKGMGKSFWWA